MKQSFYMSLLSTRRRNIHKSHILQYINELLLYFLVNGSRAWSNFFYLFFPDKCESGLNSWVYTEKTKSENSQLKSRRNKVSSKEDTES